MQQKDLSLVLQLLQVFLSGRGPFFVFKHRRNRFYPSLPEEVVALRRETLHN
jgi:hypothetical protein